MVLLLLLLLLVLLVLLLLSYFYQSGSVEHSFPFPRRHFAVFLALCPLQLAALNGRKEARGAARRSEQIRIPVGVDRLQSADTPGRNPPSGWNKRTKTKKKKKEKKEKRRKTGPQLLMRDYRDSKGSSAAAEPLQELEGSDGDQSAESFVPDIRAPIKHKNTNTDPLRCFHLTRPPLPDWTLPTARAHTRAPPCVCVCVCVCACLSLSLSLSYMNIVLHETHTAITSVHPSIHPSI